MVGFKGVYLMIQLNISEPLEIANSIELDDTLSITFTNSNVFYSVGMRKQMPANF